MQLRNGIPLRVRTAHGAHSNEFLGRLRCIDCGGVVPRGAYRPYCLKHAAYAQKVLAELRRREEEERRRAA